MKEKLHPHGITIALLIVMLASAGCKKEPVEILTRNIEEYKSGEKSSFINIEENVIRFSSFDLMEKSSFSSNGSLLYHIKGKKINIEYPFEKRLRFPEEIENPRLSVNKEYSAVSDTSQVIVYDKKNRKVLDTVLGDEKEPVYALALRDDTLFYYKNQKLYYYDLALETGSEYVSTVFKSPYAKFFNASLYQCGSYMGIIAGIAGSYYFSVVDIPEKEVVVHNIAVSSSKIHMNCDGLYYVFGTSGKWELTRFDFNSKNKDTIMNFKSLVDIEITGEGAVYLDDKGLFIILHDGKKSSIPFQYELIGKVNDHVILLYEDTLYFVDPGKLYTMLATVKEQLPEVF